MEAKRELIEQYELVKEVHYYFDGINPKIIGRIYKIILGANAEFMWAVNYYCRLPNDASVYIPGTPFGNSLEVAIHGLDAYVKRFEIAEDWKKNDSF